MTRCRRTKLTKAQQKLVGRIKRLHQKNEPLNITAVKRRYPELMRDVYAVRPFWGWRRALKAAGLDYADVRTELSDYVTCRICGREFGAVVLHLRSVHDVDTDEYRTDYPDAEFVCDTVRAARTRMKPAVLPPWDRVWSHEYILDRVSALSEAGYAINCASIMASDPQLQRAIRWYFGTMDNALCAVGLDPETIRLRSLPNEVVYRGKKDVVNAIKKRRRARLPLSRLAECAVQGSDGSSRARWSGVCTRAGRSDP